MSRKLLLEKEHVENIRLYDVYRREGGYRSVEKALKVQPNDIVEEVDTDDDVYNPEIDYEAMIADYENQEANKYSSENKDDEESGAIHETLNRMKKLINF